MYCSPVLTLMITVRSLFFKFRLPQSRYGLSRLLTLTILIPCVLLVVILLYTASDKSSRTTSWLSLPGVSPGALQLECSSEAYSEGHWAYNPTPRYNSSTSSTVISSYEEVFAYNGFHGCASSREFWFHLGVDNAERWDRFPGVTDWEWVPGENCKGLRELNGEQLVKDLVEKGGWLLLGDSVTENHFFSLSCIMYPHVRATPIYTSAGYDRAWPQNIYLLPSSPLVLTLNFPPGFSIEHTPLVTFRRSDFLVTLLEIESLHQAAYPELYNDSGRPFKLMGDAPQWTLGPSDYMPLFTAPLPDANYATLIASTAGHWTTVKFEGYSDQLGGIHGLIDFYGVAMEWWASEVQRMLNIHRKVHPRTANKNARVIVRSYLPGHSGCSAKIGPEEWAKEENGEWNWPEIPEFNSVFSDILSSSRFPDIRFLNIAKPGMLRPDAHVTSDCLHLMAGAGVLEGWTHYIWHYVTHEKV